MTEFYFQFYIFILITELTIWLLESIFFGHFFNKMKFTSNNIEKLRNSETPTIWQPSQLSNTKGNKLSDLINTEYAFLNGAFVLHNKVSKNGGTKFNNKIIIFEFPNKLISRSRISIYALKILKSLPKNSSNVAKKEKLPS